MIRVIATAGGAAQVFSGPPSDRISGRPSRVQASARAQGNYSLKDPATISAATTARANQFLEREALLDQAIHAGLINAGMRGHYAQCFDADPTGTRTYLAQLGHSQAPVPAAQGAAASGDDYPEGMLTNVERSRVAAAREGRPYGRIISGG
jgi:hypothetical protein